LNELEVEVAVLRSKMNLIAYIAGASLIATLTVLITVIMK
jgi:hypothetical protein